MDSIFWATGALVWMVIALAVVLLALLVASRVVLASVDVALQVAHVRRRGMPRSEWTAGPGEAWACSFWDGRWSDIPERVQRLRQPVKPWSKDERPAGYSRWVSGG